MFKAFVNMFKYIILFLTIIFIGFYIPLVDKAKAQSYNDNYSRYIHDREDMLDNEYYLMRERNRSQDLYYENQRLEQEIERTKQEAADPKQYMYPNHFPTY